MAVTRDFTYIDDIVKGCLGALDTAKKSTDSGGKKKGLAQLRVFNLGNTSPVPVSDLVSILEKLLKVKAKRLVMKLPRNGDVQFTHANISLAQKELGYKPTTDLQTGLKKFVRCDPYEIWEMLIAFLDFVPWKLLILSNGKSTFE
ncbi:hypothetical protein K7X08_016787 [Anisodus acutangulus]|uniref:Uncharacterized protein n=1 Tax=Anisodus acutangulus TaxID=402998 RepID=A0A9Q1LS99_9SOLA|nr:hypothetical protein K7X08_016787 [Anisodus acutangulus]